MTFISLGVIFLLLPFLAGGLWNAVTGNWPDDKVTSIIFYPNPYYVLIENTEKMIFMGGMGLGKVSWMLHCAILLSATALILLFSVLLVRKVALRQAVGQTGSSNRKKRKKKPSTRTYLAVSANL
jgi:hypothetical protein